MPTMENYFSDDDDRNNTDDEECTELEKDYKDELT